MNSSRADWFVYGTAGLVLLLAGGVLLFTYGFVPRRTGEAAPSPGLREARVQLVTGGSRRFRERGAGRRWRRHLREQRRLEQTLDRLESATGQDKLDAMEDLIRDLIRYRIDPLAPGGVPGGTPIQPRGASRDQTDTTGASPRETVSGDTADDDRPLRQRVRQGRAIYRTNCSPCHGPDRRGRPPAIPSLVNVEERRTRSYVNRLLQRGKGTMPPFPYLSASQREAVIQFLFSGASPSSGGAR